MISTGNDAAQLVIYCRASPQDSAARIDEQRNAAWRYASFHGLEVARVFEDIDVSGTILERPALLDMLHYLDEHRTERLLVLIHEPGVLGYGDDILEVLAYTVSAAGARIDTVMPLKHRFKSDFLKMQFGTILH